MSTTMSDTAATTECPDWCDTKADHEDGFDGPHTWPTIPALDGIEEDMDDDGNSSALISVHDGTIFLSAPCLTMTPEQARAAGLGLLTVAAWADGHAAAVEAVFDAGREYQRRVTARKGKAAEVIDNA